MTADLRTQLAEDVVPHESYCALWMKRGKPCQCTQRTATVAAVAAALAAARAEGAAEARTEAVGEFNRLAAEIRDEAEDADSEEAAWSLGVIALRAEVIGELLGTTPALSAHTTEGDPT